MMDTTTVIEAIIGAPLALIILGVPAALIWYHTPTQRRITRKLRDPGATVLCGCQPGGRRRHLAYRGTIDGTSVTNNGISTEHAIAALQRAGCPRIVVVDRDGATVITPHPDAITQRRTGEGR
jgi:hypothetical protein